MLIYLLLLLLFDQSCGQCPTIAIRAPCTCSSTRYEPISIVCDRAASLDVALDAIIGTQPSLPLIDSLVISNTPIEYLPAFAFRQLSIKRLVLRHNQLVGMHPSAFDGGPIRDTLIEIEIRSNRLGEIPQSGLTSLRNLRAISLSRNGIVSVPDHSFLSYQCRTILRRLDLSDNQLVDIAPLGLLGLESIEALSLDKNRFERIPTAAIAHLVSLEDLSLGVNRINRIDVGALPLPNLRSLSVEVNQLVSIDAEAFQLVPNLLYLYLSNNQFAHIDPNTFYYVNRLRVLAMGNNRQLTSVNASALQYVPELVRLELADCSIANIDRGAFHKIARVQVIVLARNRLTSIHRDTFSSLAELVSLDLHANSLSQIEDGAFSNLPAIKHLDISGNRLHTLMPHTFVDSLVPSLPITARVLYLYDNPWNCDQSLAWMRTWLRANADIQINAPGYPPTRCTKPIKLAGVDIKQVDDSGVVSIKKPKQQTIMRSFGAGHKQKPTVDMLHKATAITTDERAPEQRLAGVDLAAVILSIILGIFLISVILLMLVRYLVSNNRRQRKRRDGGRAHIEDDFGGAGSSSIISGYGTGTTASCGGGGYTIGSAYPSSEPTIIYRQQQPTTTVNGGGYFLNRPWYWWF